MTELLLLAALIVVGAVITGVLAGLFGIGGGGVIVPILYEIFRAFAVSDSVRMQLCIGTSLAIIVPTAIRSFRAHRRHGAVIDGIIRQWLVPSVIGVFTGAAVAAVAPGSVFKAAFAVIGGSIAVKLLLGRDHWRVGEQLPQGFAMRVYGFVIGLASSLMGVAGGAISTMVLTLHGQPIHGAVATSAGLGVPITLAGAVGFMLAGLPHQAQMPPLSIGYVSLIGFALMAPISSLVAPYGARLAHALPKRRLEQSFGCFLLAVSFRFAYGAATGA